MDMGRGMGDGGWGRGDGQGRRGSTSACHCSGRLRRRRGSRRCSPAATAPGHQDAHKVRRTRARRGRDATTALSLAAAGEQGKAAVDDDSAPLRLADPDAADAWGGGRVYPPHRQQGSGAASSGAARGNEELADEMIDLSLKL
uniref:Uncharacterized protein n=1 Tax=Aegilops tauschii TaxID=37682 RepID=N1R2P1_AEGTA